MKALQSITPKPGDRVAGMNSCSPQDLIAEQVAEPGDQPLVHERGLDFASPALQQPSELVRVDVQRVRAEGAGGRLSLCGGPDEPDAAEPAHIPVAKPSFG
jgi:hypothetical protein